MTQTQIQVQTPRGTMPVHIHHPDGDPRAPLVVLFMDAPGVRPALHQYADQLAQAGYRTAIPDLYYDIDPADLLDLDRLHAGEGSEFARMGSLAARIDDTEVVGDTELMLDALGAEGAWGSVGFCLGGRLGLRAAQRFGGQVAAAALLHPSRLVSDEPDAPYREVDQITAALYLGYGENDHVSPPSTIPPVREQLERNDVSFEIDVMAGADHGFMMPGMPAYNPAAAAQGWAATMALLGERLPPAR